MANIPIDSSLAGADCVRVTLTDADWGIVTHPDGSVTDATTGALLMLPAGMTEDEWVAAQIKA